MPEISKLRGVAGQAGEIVSANHAELIGRLAESLFGPINRQIAESLAALWRPTLDEAIASVIAAAQQPIAETADEIGPHHHVEESDLCRN